MPDAVRDPAEKSVEQAEKAFESFMTATSKSVALVPGPATDISENAMALTQKNMKTAFDHARRLIYAKDVQEVMQLQADFLRSQFAAASEQKELSTGAVFGCEGRIERHCQHIIGQDDI